MRGTWSRRWKMPISLLWPLIVPAPNCARLSREHAVRDIRDRPGGFSGARAEAQLSSNAFVCGLPWLCGGDRTDLVAPGRISQRLHISVDRVMVSLITTTFLSLAGFYIIKNAVERDRQTGAGEILASTPLSRTAYLLGKFLSNLSVLVSMLVVLAVSAIAMQFLVAEDGVFNAWALLSPFLLLSLPALALTAALAVLFETTRLLRGGLGNVAWFFVWGMVISLPRAIHAPYLDPSGVWTVFRSVVPAARAIIPGYKD